jgi:hypothetical protein
MQCIPACPSSTTARFHGSARLRAAAERSRTRAAAGSYIDFLMHSVRLVVGVTGNANCDQQHGYQPVIVAARMINLWPSLTIVAG